MMMAAKIPLPILQLDHAMALLEDHSYAQVVKLTGISKSTLIRERKRRRQFGAPEKIKEPPSPCVEAPLG